MADQEEAHLFEDEPALIQCLPELNDLRMAGELTDLAIEVQGNVTLHVHRVILVSRIASLRYSVCGALKKNKAVLQWPKVSSEVARPLMDYVYTGQLAVNEDNAAGLVILSKQLLLPKVEEWALSFMADRLNSENLANNWNLAQLLKSDQLRNACLQHIKTTFEATIVSDFFTHLPLDTVLSVLRADDLEVDSEERVFEAIRLWVSPRGEVDETRIVHAKALMREVRWNRINPDFRYKLLENEGFWNKDVECLRLLGGISGWFECPSSRADRKCPFNENYRGPLEKICLIGTSTTDKKSVLIRYDTETSTSEQLTVLDNRSCAAFVAIADCIFAIGTYAQNGSCSKVEKFDTKELQWSERAPLSSVRQYHAAIGVSVGQECVVCVFGGCSSNYGSSYSNICELYSPQENRWYVLPSLKESRQNAAAVALPDGQVFVIGGRNVSGYLVSSVEACHLREPADWQGQRKTPGDFWRSVASMNNPRGNHTAIAFRGSIFVAGGTNTNGTSVETVEVFSPPDNQQQMGQWTKLTNGTLKWPNAHLAVWQDRLFAFCSNANRQNSIREFVPRNPSAASRKKFDLWTWTDRGPVNDLRLITHAFILR
uniref:Kelch-like protein 20 n=1 Tax=Schistocephalus solidus TaxID=70667 RepID=A0A0X3PGM8_SCHSO